MNVRYGQGVERVKRKGGLLRGDPQFEMTDENKARRSDSRDTWTEIPCRQKIPAYAGCGLAHVVRVRETVVEVYGDKFGFVFKVLRDDRFSDAARLEEGLSDTLIEPDAIDALMALFQAMQWMAGERSRNGQLERADGVL